MDLVNITDFVGALIINLLLWIGFVATIAINQNNFKDRGVKLFLLEYGYYLIGFLVAGILFTLW